MCSMTTNQTTIDKLATRLPASWVHEISAQEHFILLSIFFLVRFSSISLIVIVEGHTFFLIASFLTLFLHIFHVGLSADYIPVLLDGIVLGGILPKDAPEIVAQLRYLKAASNNCGLHAQGSSTSSTDINTVNVLSKNKLLLDPTMEVAYIPRLPYDCAYPGVYLFTQAGRMIRPVLQLGTHYVEWIGPMEVSNEILFSFKIIIKDPIFEK